MPTKIYFTANDLSQVFAMGRELATNPAYAGEANVTARDENGNELLSFTVALLPPPAADN